MAEGDEEERQGDEEADVDHRGDPADSDDPEAIEVCSDKKKGK